MIHLALLPCLYTCSTSDNGILYHSLYPDNSIPSDRLNKRQYGTLKGKALTKARKLVEQQGSIGCSG